MQMRFRDIETETGWMHKKYPSKEKAEGQER